MEHYLRTEPNVRPRRQSLISTPDQLDATFANCRSRYSTNEHFVGPISPSMRGTRKWPALRAEPNCGIVNFRDLACQGNDHIVRSSERVIASLSKTMDHTRLSRRRAVVTDEHSPAR
jgi:hypothetical protein